MDLFTAISEIYPELETKDFNPQYGSIILADDGDGVQYIAEWNYSKPLPKGFKLGK
jgi:hypothetical protein